MKGFAEFRALDRSQRAVFIAGLLGWSLDAFDYFLFTFVLQPIAAEFHAEVKDVALGLTLTLACRPVGALLFGWLADRFGRRPVLMADVVLFAVIELASAFAPSLRMLLVLRALFGIAMGGEWGVGSALVMESLPPPSRGIFSGILQEGYALGYLLAAVAYYFCGHGLGWRGLFALGALPALLSVYIRRNVPESPVWRRDEGRRNRVGLAKALRRHVKLLLYAMLLMAAFNAFSHGTQDLYQTFLKVQRGLSIGTVSLIVIVGNLGAIGGGIGFGAASQRIGRRRAIILAAALALPIIPLWVSAGSPLLLGLGAFFIQFAVQGAWGVIPAHLNELSPPEIRGVFPGFSYQLGNLLAAGLPLAQAWIAARHGGDYAHVLAAAAAGTAVAIIVIAALGREAKESILT